MIREKLSPGVQLIARSSSEGSKAGLMSPDNGGLSYVDLVLRDGVQCSHLSPSTSKMNCGLPAW